MNRLIAKNSCIGKQSKFGNCGWRFLVKRCPGFVEDAHVLQTAHSETHQLRKIILELGTDDLQRPSAPETISGVLGDVPANAEVQLQLLLIGKPDCIVLALEDGLLD